MSVTVGLTGGIASGKSFVARIFQNLGVPVVDADQIAREVVAPGSEALGEITAAFGKQYLLLDGTLDRKKLGDLVFQDAEARKKLNAITHPRIGLESAQRIAALQERSPPYVIYEAALLVENGLHKNFAALVVVRVDDEIQLRRLIAREGISEQAARERVAAQMPLEAKLAVADYVIDNSGAEDNTRRETEGVHRALVVRFGRSA